MTPTKISRGFSRETSCLGKKKYSSKKNAKLAAKHRYKFGGGPMVVYKCDFCPYWHLGHPTKSPLVKK